MSHISNEHMTHKKRTKNSQEEQNDELEDMNFSHNDSSLFDDCLEPTTAECITQQQIDVISDNDDNDDAVYRQMFEDNLPEDDEFAESLLQVFPNETAHTTGSPHLSYICPNSTSNCPFDLNALKPFSTISNNVYFYLNHTMKRQCNQVHGGLCGIVWRAIKRQEVYTPQHTSSLKDARLMFNITNHLVSNTANQKEEFLEILEDILERYSSGLEGAEITLPVDMKSANAICLDGKFGIFNNLPCEEIFNIGGHACISLNEKLSHILGHGVPIEYGSKFGKLNLDGINGTEAFKDLLEKMKTMNPNHDSTAFGWLMLWSDSFLRHFVKQKENSVWILTVTLPNPDNNATSPFHTYCLAIGQSKLDHTPVVEYYLRELDIIKRGVVRYSAETGDMIRTAFDMIAYVMDRPERSAVLNTMHLGIFGKRSLWAAGVDTNQLPYCNTCFTRAVASFIGHNSVALPACCQCCQWDYESESPAAKKFPLPNDYPTSVLPDSPPFPEFRTLSETYLRPKRMTFDWLQKGLQVAEHNLRKGHWTQKPTFDYLRSCGISKAVQQKVWDNRSNADGPSTPALWKSDYPIDVAIDAGMHHIFHGITDDIIVLITDFLKEHSLATTFDDSVNPFLLEISSFRLDWCRMKKLPSKQWLAEDLLGFSRIMPFVYGQFFLQHKISDTTRTSEETLVSIQQLLNSLHVMVSHLMSPRDPDVEKIDLSVKIFLSCGHRFVRSHYSPETVPFWASKGNEVSLLNLASQIKYRGPIRLYWEGTRERFIQTVKKVLCSLRKSASYYERKLCLIQKLNTVHWLREDIRRKGKRPSPYKGYYRYDSLPTIKDKFNEGTAISALTLKNQPELVYVAFGRGKSDECTLVPIKYIVSSHDLSRRQCGFTYATCILETYTLETRYDELEDLLDSYCLLLPFCRKNREFGSEYAIVFHDWDVVDHNGEKNISSLCDHIFSKDIME